ncbi:hypothetical protein [Acidithiobacillus thiooxidans]|uniref:hypothetical protein n=1 Tax=Acidithiobacillus thiooxidans TaxID=930 RepID=UPI0004E1CACF|nr:hypothetical protein [Acidithiobacillus thiooxidans]
MWIKHRLSKRLAADRRAAGSCGRHDRLTAISACSRQGGYSPLGVAPLQGFRALQGVAPQPGAEAGVAAILYVLVLMIFLAAVVSVISARLDDFSHQRLKQTQTIWLDHAQQQLQGWYAQNAAWLDAGGNGSAPPISASGMLSAAGVQPLWNAQLFVSNATCQSAAQGSLCYRSLWLAIPSMAGTAPTLQNGVFVPNGARYVSVSGQAIETRLYNAALHQVKRMGTLLESGFAASESSGALHNDDLDWFAPEGCTNGNGDGPFACSNGGWISWADYTQGSGLAGTQNKNPWGYAVEVNNSGGEASDTATPYSVELSSPLPWGGAITSLVAQPF